MATAAHTEAPGGGHKGPFPPFQKETFASQLVWFAVFFVALYVIMSKLALPRIGTILAERRQRIEDDLKAAQRLKETSDAELAAYEKALADARGRAQAIANETRDKLNAEAEQTRWRRRSTPRSSAEGIMINAEFWVAVAFVIFVGFAIYMGLHRMILDALD